MDQPKKLSLAGKKKRQRCTGVRASLVTVTVHTLHKNVPLLGVRHPFSQNSRLAFDPLKTSLNPTHYKLGERTETKTLCFRRLVSTHFIFVPPTFFQTSAHFVCHEPVIHLINITKIGPTAPISCLYLFLLGYDFNETHINFTKISDRTSAKCL